MYNVVSILISKIFVLLFTVFYDNQNNFWRCSHSTTGFCKETATTERLKLFLENKNLTIEKEFI